ncbi:MarR family winged helix-turn-helix transcriptional regulator [Microlunatus sp. GCM10028923]|uniref:MarR family winged helix-turn-helix transcriptional regulator n=1 Tax=Microlunatus sp. GCM10028923 TaxID=3273400 RepID=UPI0036208A32
MSEISRRPPSLLALPSYLAGHVARIGRRGLEEELQRQGLRPPHFAVLTALVDLGPLAQYELADRLGFNRSHLVGYLDALEEQRLVRRERDAEDRRRHRVALTRSGRSLQARLYGVAEQSQAEALGVLSAAERRQLASLLRRVVDARDE